MFDRHALYQRLGCLLCGAVTGAAAMSVAVTKLTVPPKYSEFIVGAITWEAHTKLQDLMAPVVFLLFSVGAAWATHRVFALLRASGSHDAIEALFWHLTLWAIPAAIGLGSVLPTSSFDRTFVYVSAIGQALYLGAIWLVLSRGETCRPRAVNDCVISVFLFGLFPVSVLLVLSRLGGDVELRVEPFVKSIPVVSVIASGLIGGYAFRTARLTRAAPTIVSVAQAGLPAFFLLLIPQRFNTPEGVYVLPWGTALGVIVGGLIAWAYLDIWRRYRSCRVRPIVDASALSPVAFFALFVAFRIPHTVRPWVSVDDYHFGELILGWWTWAHQGLIPYVDYLPAHGIGGDYLAAAMSALIFDGTPSVLFESMRVGHLAVALFVFVIMLRRTGSLPLSFLSVLMFAGGALLLLAGFLLLFCYAPHRTRPIRWLWFWIFSAPIVVLALPAFGILMLVATSPIAVWCVWRAWIEGDTRQQGALLGAAVALGALVLITPVGAMLSGAVQYVLDNGPINQLAYGIAWSISWGYSGQSGLVFECVRMSWLVAPAVACYTALRGWAEPERRLRALATAVPVVLFSLLLIPYTMGRMDPGAVSRAGLLSSFAWAFLIPMLVWPAGGPLARAALLIAAACFGGGLGHAGLSKARVLRSLPPAVATAGPVQRGADYGMPGMGNGFFDPDHLRRLKQVMGALDRFLEPGEGYLDLTGRNAHHVYFDRPPVIPVTAPYNMAPIPQQRRAVERLRQTPPRVALFHAYNRNHDGGTLSLRNPVLYRYVISRYRPTLIDGVVLGIRSESRPSSFESDLVVKDLTDTVWLHGVHRAQNALIVAETELTEALTPGDTVTFADSTTRRIEVVRPDLNAIWLDGPIPGRPSSRTVLSFDDAEQSLQHLEDDGSGAYRVTGVDPFVVFPVRDGVSGQDADLLRFRVSCDAQTKPLRIQVFWWGDEYGHAHEASSVFVDVLDQAVEVSLGHHAGWNALKRVRGLRLDLADATSCEWIRFEGVELVDSLGPVEPPPRVTLQPEKAGRLTRNLLHRAFGQQYLEAVPIAWGRSERSLSRRMVSVVKPPTADVTHAPATGPWTSVTVPLGRPVAGTEAGLLRFRVSCPDRHARPMVRLVWNARADGPVDDATSIYAKVADGIAIVPLDASVGWLLDEDIRSIRLDVVDTAGVQDLKFDGFELLQRRSVIERPES